MYKNDVLSILAKPGTFLQRIFNIQWICCIDALIGFDHNGDNLVMDMAPIVRSIKSTKIAIVPDNQMGHYID